MSADYIVGDRNIVSDKHHFSYPAKIISQFRQKCSERNLNNKCVISSKHETHIRECICDFTGADNGGE